MKRRLFILVVLALGMALLAFTFRQTVTTRDKMPGDQQGLDKKGAIGCSPDWKLLEEWLSETEIPPIPGAGSYKWKITTANDSAQFYFNQGINMYYGFHIIEAMASFKKAEKFDPNAAMIHWAKALAYGPNINDLGYAASPDALTAINKAIELSGDCNAIEKGLIFAQAVRYSPDSTQTREHLNQLYADK